MSVSKIETSMNYPLNVLHKHKATLEVNLKIVPGIQVNLKMLPVFRRQLREVCQAIEYLEKAGT